MKNFSFWIKLCVFNFFIVSVVGVIMRYQRVFPFSEFNYRFIREAHSHFAFYGWVTACVYLFVAYYLSKNHEKINISKYQFVMIVNQIGSYGMLVTFFCRGYFWLSIVFSAVALFTGFAYFIFLLIDTKRIKKPEIIWLQSATFFATLSAIGIFGTAYFSSHKNEFEPLFRASIYLYLHYQYNGFFLFSCIGLFLISFKKYGIEIPEKLNKNIFYLLFTGCFFGYGLSVLWMEMSKFLYIFITVISIVQLFGAYKLWSWVRRNYKELSEPHSFIQKMLLGVFGLAFLLKFILQTASAIPALSDYIFSNVNTIVAYLHLILLMGISLFLIWKIINLHYFIISKTLMMSVISLVFGIVFNEIILSLVSFLSVFSIPFLSSVYWLLFASLVIMVSIAVFLKSLKI